MGLFSNTPTKQIQKIKLLGIRTSEQTKVLSTVNSSVYCIAVLYTDGTKELVEVEAKEFQKTYLQYVEI